MSANGSTDSAQTFADEALAFIAARIPAIEPVSAMLNQRLTPDGNLYDVMDVGFMLPPYLDVFYVHPNAEKNWKRLALHSITLKATQVLSIYAGYPVREDVIPIIDPQPDDYADGSVPGSLPPPLVMV